MPFDQNYVYVKSSTQLCFLKHAKKTTQNNLSKNMLPINTAATSCQSKDDKLWQCYKNNAFDQF